MKTAIIANGTFPATSGVAKIIGLADYLVAVDGGANHCQQLGIIPDLLIGDLDSIDQQSLALCSKDDVEIERHPVEKDATDLELALQSVQARGAKQVSLFGALGGRLDMSFANIMLAAAECFCDMEITFFTEKWRIYILPANRPLTISGQAGQRVSLMPLGGPAGGVTLHNFHYPLRDHTIEPGSTIGISNVMLGGQATVEHRHGVLVCFHEAEDG